MSRVAPKEEIMINDDEKMMMSVAEMTLMTDDVEVTKVDDEAQFTYEPNMVERSSATNRGTKSTIARSVVAKHRRSISIDGQWLRGVPPSVSTITGSGAFPNLFAAPYKTGIAGDDATHAVSLYIVGGFNDAWYHGWY